MQFNKKFIVLYNIKGFAEINVNDNCWMDFLDVMSIVIESVQKVCTRRPSLNKTMLFTAKDIVVHKMTVYFICYNTLKQFAWHTSK